MKKRSPFRDRVDEKTPGTIPGAVERVLQSSFIQTLTVGFGIAPNHAQSALVGCTTGRDLHPALKILLSPM